LTTSNVIRDFSQGGSLVCCLPLYFFLPCIQRTQAKCRRAISKIKVSKKFIISKQTVNVLLKTKPSGAFCLMLAAGYFLCVDLSANSVFKNTRNLKATVYYCSCAEANQPSVNYCRVGVIRFCQDVKSKIKKRINRAVAQ